MSFSTCRIRLFCDCRPCRTGVAENGPASGVSDEFVARDKRAARRLAESAGWTISRAWGRAYAPGHRPKQGYKEPGG